MMKKKTILTILCFVAIVMASMLILFPTPDGYFEIKDISKSYDFILISKNKSPDHITYEVEGETSDTLYTDFGIFMPGKINTKYPYETYWDTVKINYRPMKKGLKGYFKVKYWF
jgi:hypothetical protein